MFTLKENRGQMSLDLPSLNVKYRYNRKYKRMHQGCRFEYCSTLHEVVKNMCEAADRKTF